MTLTELMSEADRANRERPNKYVDRPTTPVQLAATVALVLLVLIAIAMVIDGCLG